MAFFLCPLSIWAQEVYSRKAVRKLLKQSDRTYEFTEVREGIWPGFLRETHDPGIMLVTLEGEQKLLRPRLAPPEERFFKLGNAAFDQQEFEEARNYYLEVVERRPEYSVPYVMVGQTYWMEGEAAAAKKVLERALEINFYDYSAHWALSGVLNEMGETERAQEEIILAILLNINEEKLWESADSIFAKTGQVVDRWTFEPKFRIQESGGVVEIYFHPEWEVYALVRALWAYEKDSEGEEVSADLQATHTFLAELEAIESLAEAGAGSGKSGFGERVWFREMEAADGAGEEEIQHFVMVNVLLPRNPMMVFFQEKETLEAMGAHFRRARIRAQGD